MDLKNIACVTLVASSFLLAGCYGCQTPPVRQEFVRPSDEYSSSAETPTVTPEDITSDFDDLLSDETDEYKMEIFYPEEGRSDSKSVAITTKDADDPDIEYTHYFLVKRTRMRDGKNYKSEHSCSWITHMRNYMNKAKAERRKEAGVSGNGQWPASASDEDIPSIVPEDITKDFDDLLDDETDDYYMEVDAPANSDIETSKLVTITQKVPDNPRSEVGHVFRVTKTREHGGVNYTTNHICGSFHFRSMNDVKLYRKHHG